MPSNSVVPLVQYLESDKELWVKPFLFYTSFLERGTPLLANPWIRERNENIRVV